jgi:DNA-binding transcriptional LysR family regulator
MEHDAQADGVVAPEGGRGDSAARVAVDAGAVHVERAGDVAGILFISIGHGFSRGPAIEADNFDFIVNLVSLGLGASLMPHRVLALHPATRPVIRIRTLPRFSRQLAVIVRREATRPEVISTFVDNVLF